MNRLLIRGGVVPGAGPLDLLAEDGMIVRLAPHIDAQDAKVVQAQGRALMPGMVDMHCHLRDPGFEYKEDIASGSRAAAAGGFTSICCMANTKPVNDNAAVTRYIVEKAARESVVRVYPVGALSQGLEGKQLAEIGDMKKAGIIAVSDDGKPVMNSQLMRLAMEYCKSFNLTILDHCEDVNLVADGVMNEGYMSTLLGLPGVTRAAEEVQIARDILLSQTLDAPIHICHVSTMGGVAMIRAAKAQGVRVTCETAPHYLAGTDDMVQGYDADTRVNPPLRLLKDQEALIAGLCDGTIDCIATDHAPHHRDEKEVEYALAASGISGFETAFALSMGALVQAHHMTLEDFVRVACTRPAEILGLPQGRLEPGRPADFILADLKESWRIDRNKLLSKGKNTPFHGRLVRGRVKATYVAGQCVYEEA